jgi:3-oxoacyl-[acyl-carrier-protein] synthase-1
MASAVDQARKLLYESGHPWVLAAASDSLLVAETLEAFESEDRLLTSENSNGFIPGEAAAAILLGRTDHAGDTRCVGVGFGMEAATITSDNPLRADGMVGAIRAALKDAACEFSDLSFRIADLSGEHYPFKEASLAQSRLMRNSGGEFPLWHPADCIGEVGASFGPIAMGLVATAFARGYSPGPTALIHLAEDAGTRAAMIIKSPEIA